MSLLAGVSDAQTSLPPITVAARIEREVHVLLWQVRGTADVRVADQTINLQENHALWIPVGTEHSFRLSADSALLPVLLDADGAEVGASLRSPAVYGVDERLGTLLLVQVQGSYSIVRSSADVHRQIVRHLQTCPPLPAALPLPCSDAARRIALALLADPADERSVVQLAAAAHTSSRSVERAFRAETGVTLRTWRLASRMEAAGALLRRGLSVDAVAARVGYSSVSAFRRAFKGHFSLTPSAYLLRRRGT